MQAGIDTFRQRYHEADQGSCRTSSNETLNLRLQALDASRVAGRRNCGFVYRHSMTSLPTRGCDPPSDPDTLSGSAENVRSKSGFGFFSSQRAWSDGDADGAGVAGAVNCRWVGLDRCGWWAQVVTPLVHPTTRLWPRSASGGNRSKGT